MDGNGWPAIWLLTKLFGQMLVGGFERTWAGRVERKPWQPHGWWVEVPPPLFQFSRVAAFDPVRRSPPPISFLCSLVLIED